MGKKTSEALQEIGDDLMVYASPPIVFEALKFSEQVNDKDGTLDPFISLLRCSLLCSAEGLRGYGGVIALLAIALTEANAKDVDNLCAAVIRAIKPYIKENPFFVSALAVAAMDIEKSSQVMKKLANGERVGQVETSVNIAISTSE